MLDTLLEEPRDTPWNKWACGVGFPVLLSVWAARIMIVQHLVVGRLFRRFGRLEFSGSDAWWFGLAILGFAAMVHCHFFWTNQDRLAPYADFGKIASLIAVVTGLGFVVVSLCQFV